METHDNSEVIKEMSVYEKIQSHEAKCFEWRRRIEGNDENNDNDKKKDEET